MGCQQRPIRFTAFEAAQEIAVPVGHAADQRCAHLLLSFDQPLYANGLFGDALESIAVFIGEVFDASEKHFAHGTVLAEKINDKSLAQLACQALICKEVANIEFVILSKNSIWLSKQ